MNLSLNEVEATARKAVRGAGYSWGLAEEAGRATRWLCCQNIDGCMALANLLNEFDGVSSEEKIAKVESHEWITTHKSMCALTMGASLSDFATSLHVTGLTMKRVCEPVLLLYFAAMVSMRKNTTVRVQWDSNVAVTDGKRLNINAPEMVNNSDVFIDFEHTLGATCELQSRAHTTRLTWRTLNVYASRTYAPATEHSRMSGAGSGSANDN